MLMLASTILWAFRQRTPGMMVHSWSGRAPRMVMRMVDCVVHFVSRIVAMMEDSWMVAVHILVVVIQSLLLVGSSYEVADPTLILFRANGSHDNERGEGDKAKNDAYLDAMALL
jgi:hypothetical protein